MKSTILPSQAKLRRLIAAKDTAPLREALRKIEGFKAFFGVDEASLSAVLDKEFLGRELAACVVHRRWSHALLLARSSFAMDVPDREDIEDMTCAFRRARRTIEPALVAYRLDRRGLIFPSGAFNLCARHSRPLVMVALFTAALKHWGKVDIDAASLIKLRFRSRSTIQADYVIDQKRSRKSDHVEAFILCSILKKEFVDEQTTELPRDMAPDILTMARQGRAEALHMINVVLNACEGEGRAA